MTKPIADTAPDLGAWAARPEAVAPEQAARAFESLLIQQILERAQQPVFESKLLGGGSADSVYRTWFAQALADQMAARGGFGLAAATLRAMEPRAGEEGKP